VRKSSCNFKPLILVHNLLLVLTMMCLNSFHVKMCSNYFNPAEQDSSPMYKTKAEGICGMIQKASVICHMGL
jgi:hypothetical protein